MNTKKPCWCCNNASTVCVQKFHSFVVEKAHLVTVTEMATQFLVVYPNVDTVENLVEHVNTHFLHPSVFVSRTLRNLIKMSDQIQQITTSVNEEDGSPLVDSRSVNLYLKIVNDIMGIYRNTEMKKMLYSE